MMFRTWRNSDLTVRVIKRRLWIGKFYIVDAGANGEVEGHVEYLIGLFLVLRDVRWFAIDVLRMFEATAFHFIDCHTLIVMIFFVKSIRILTPWAIQRFTLMKA